MAQPPEPTRLGEPVWLEPYPDVLLEGVPDTAPGPEAYYETREAIGLAFITALQHLLPRQRAALLLRDVLGFGSSEVADMLGSTEASVKGALQWARATLEARIPAGGRELAPLPHPRRERAVVGRFVDAVERGDTDAIVALLAEDAWLRLGDLLGRRRILLAGLTLFSGASLLAGLAQSQGLLIGTRALQGFGAALVAPAALSILAVTFAEGREGALPRPSVSSSVGC